MSGARKSEPYFHFPDFFFSGKGRGKKDVRRSRMKIEEEKVRGRRRSRKRRADIFRKWGAFFAQKIWESARGKAAFEIYVLFSTGHANVR